MYVAELFDSLGFAPYIEIVVAGLPQRSAFRRLEFSSCILLQHLNGDRKLFPFGFADEQVDMFGHHDEAANVESVPDSRGFEHAQERVPSAWISEQWV